jgi:hypothetical protein
MGNLAHSASLHSGDKNAPSNPGIKHLGALEEHDLPARRKMRYIALKVPLGLLPLGRREGQQLPTSPEARKSPLDQS